MVLPTTTMSGAEDEPVEPPSAQPLPTSSASPSTTPREPREPRQSPPPTNRPLSNADSTEFNSLHDLLAQAGYKETYVDSCSIPDVRPRNALSRWSAWWWGLSSPHGTAAKELRAGWQAQAPQAEFKRDTRENEGHGTISTVPCSPTGNHTQALSNSNLPPSPRSPPHLLASERKRRSTGLDRWASHPHLRKVARSSHACEAADGAQGCEPHVPGVRRQRSRNDVWRASVVLHDEDEDQDDPVQKKRKQRVHSGSSDKHSKVMSCKVAPKDALAQATPAHVLPTTARGTSSAGPATTSDLSKASTTMDASDSIHALLAARAAQPVVSPDEAVALRNAGCLKPMHWWSYDSVQVLRDALANWPPGPPGPPRLPGPAGSAGPAPSSSSSAASPYSVSAPTSDPLPVHGTTSTFRSNKATAHSAAASALTKGTKRSIPRLRSQAHVPLKLTYRTDSTRIPIPTARVPQQRAYVPSTTTQARAT